MRNKQIFFITATLTPVMILFFVFSFLPILASGFLAFGSYDLLRNSFHFTGIENIKDLFSDKLFVRSIWNTFYFVAVAMPINIVITLFIALAIHHVKSARLRNAFRAFVFIPTVAPVVGSAIVWGTMYRFNDGLFNAVMRYVGIEPVHWLSDPNISILSVTLMVLWADIGFNIVIFMAGLNSIPEMFYEAAQIEGAGRFRIFWSITLPLLNRTTVFVTIMTLLSYFQMFVPFKVMTNGGPFNSTLVIPLEIYNTAFKYFNMGYASMMALVLLAIMLILTVIQLKVGKSRWEY